MVKERELEVKVLNMDLGLLEKRIQELGGTLLTREHQINTHLVPPSEEWIPGGSYLRVRTVDRGQDQYSLLTYKALISKDQVRENIETHSKISSPQAVIQIFQAMGFRADTGTKERTSYSLMGARLDLDRWDAKTYPHPYMEIEVSDQGALEAILKALNIPEDKVSRKSIAELQAELLK